MISSTRVVRSVSRVPNELVTAERRILLFLHLRSSQPADTDAHARGVDMRKRRHYTPHPKKQRQTTLAATMQSILASTLDFTRFCFSLALSPLSAHRPRYSRIVASSTMLLSHCRRLRLSSDVRIVLASSSPRRQQLMDQLLPNVPFQSIPSTFDEKLSHSDYSTAAEYAIATSEAKGREVWSKGQADLLISADTVVSRDQRILEKPTCQEKHQYALYSLDDSTLIF